MSENRKTSALEEMNTRPPTRHQDAFERFFELSPDMMCLAGTDGYFKHLNPAFEVVLGWTVAELQAQPFTEFIHPDDVDNTGKAMDKLARNATAVYFENRYRCKDGSYKWLAWKSRSEEDGEIIYASARDITTQKHNEIALQKSVAELEIITKLSAAAAAITDSDALLQEAVNLIKSSFDLYHAHIYLLNDIGTKLVLHIGAGEIGRQLVEEGHQIPLSDQQSLVARAARTRRGVYENDLRAAPSFLPNPLLPDTRSALAIPMIVGDQLLGILNVQSNIVNNFTDEDIQIHTTLAEQIATALQSARNFSRSEAAINELNALTRRLTREGWQAHLSSPSKESLDYIYNADEMTAAVKATNVEASGPVQISPIMSHAIRVQGSSVGFLELEEPEAMRAEEAQNIIEAVTERLGFHLENLRLSEEARQRADELTVVNRVAQAVSQQLNIEQLLDNVLQEIQHIFQLDSFFIALQDEQTQMLRFPVYFENGKTYKIDDRTLTTNSYALKTIQTGQAQLVHLTPEEVQTRSKSHGENEVVVSEEHDTTASLIFVPLSIGTEVIGVMSLQSYAFDQYNESDIPLLTGIAGYVAVALQNARLFSQAQQRAERERLVNSITQKIQSTATIEGALQTAIQELGKALRSRQAQVMLAPTQQGEMQSAHETGVLSNG